MSVLVPIVMSGGSGTRMWPKSRQEYPKQFLPLFNETSMLQDTVLRLEGLNAEAPLLICNESHRFLVAEQLLECDVKPNSIVLEPFGRNTAPAIAVAALSQSSDDAILLVLAADHVITNVEEFHRLVKLGEKVCAEGKLVTFGIVPSKPETGYGYIQAGDELESGVHSVEAFVEKPDSATAEQYVSAGNYFWNSGMFMFRAKDFLKELEERQPKILEHCRAALTGAQTDLDFVRLNAAAFEKCPSDSIDYAVMEHTKNGVVIPSDIGWSDVGSWSSLWEVSDKDSEGNRFVGDVIAKNSNNNFVHSDGRLVTLVGINDVVVVDTDDAVLIASRDQVQDVKSIVEELKSSDRTEHLNHRKVGRPWGSYDSIDMDDNFQVKRITVNPGASLSLQMHHHRAEHWIVVSGTAEVTCGEKVYLVEKNQSTYIPLGEKHRLRNPGKIPLKMIEVQSGDYLGEDDIVRFEDVYGRTEDPSE
jgi:mannose-1-phosphate guanylyltransferase/mannose-6-phosphate isomerase